MTATKYFWSTRVVKILPPTQSGSSFDHMVTWSEASYQMRRPKMRWLIYYFLICPSDLVKYSNGPMCHHTSTPPTPPNKLFIVEFTCGSFSRVAAWVHYHLFQISVHSYVKICSRIDRKALCLTDQSADHVTHMTGWAENKNMTKFSSRWEEGPALEVVEVDAAPTRPICKHISYSYHF